MKRREFIGVLAAAATWPLKVSAQQAPQIRQVCVLLYSKEDRNTIIAPFISRLHALGYGDGKNVIIQYRHGDGTFETLSKAAEDLVRLHADVIYSLEANPPR